MLRGARFRDGERVQATKGPFINEFGIYAGQSRKDRVFVLLTLLGGQRRVEIAESSLIAA